MELGTYSSFEVVHCDEPALSRLGGSRAVLWNGVVYSSVAEGDQGDEDGLPMGIWVSLSPNIGSTKRDVYTYTAQQSRE